MVPFLRYQESWRLQLEVAVSLLLLQTTQVFAVGGVFLPDDIYSCGQWHSGSWFVLCFFPISRNENFQGIKNQKSDHINLAFSLQDNLLGLLEQLCISL